MNLLKFEIRTDWPGAPQFRRWTIADALCRNARGAVVFQENVRRHVQRRADPEKALETMGSRPASERLSKIHILQARSAAVPIHAEMPLPDHCSHIAMRPKKRRPGDAIRFDQRGTISTENTRL